ncbi:MAG: SpoIIE family protein phosphatase [Bacteroidales bacterium]|nr:SpoIIE family protein phosphatase [Bacteroidales bacterium]
MKFRTTTIFNQLILNIALPTLLALLVFAVINFQHTRSNLISRSEERNRLISEQVTNVIEFQDIAFELIDQELTRKLEDYSDLLVNQYLKSTEGIETLDLFQIAGAIGMDLRNEDIYIVSRNGEVVNTTFAEDLGLNLFSFGEKHKEHLMHVFDTGIFVPELFTVEAKTLRPRKYSYQTTLDRNYIVELGVYSSKADDILEMIESVKAKMIDKEKGILDVELFVLADKPFSLNINAMEVPAHDSILLRSFVRKDTISMYEKSGRSWLHYQYIYMPRLNTKLYDASVIRIISDRTSEKYLFRTELTRFAIILALTLIVVTSLIYRKTRVITTPIKKLVDSVDRITDGHLNERAEVAGNNEITRLSERFNMMISQLESYYNELEEMVRERTRKIEEQKKHIMDSIYYARRIQTAILPSQNIINKLLPSSFVFYLPKDIVSGDFYWIHESKGHIMVAAVDCTGHGVPGAFMSIVGFNQLNHAVNVAGAIKASDILDELNKGVIHTLNEGSETTSIRDGMDIALIVMEPERRIVHFAGANNPLIIIRNNELIKVRGDRLPIGAFEGSKPQAFTNNEIEILEGDMVYLFSDGFADQFGGKEGKKFLIGRFQQLLMDIHTLPVEQQKEELQRRLQEWMGDISQIDDILVIGIRI